MNPELKNQINDYFKQDPVAAAKQFGEDPFEVKNVLARWVRGHEDKDELHCIPTDTLYLNIDKEAVLKSGMMLPKDSAGNVVIPERMAISLAGKRALYKGDLMLLEMVANSNWTRPLYVALTVGQENYMNLGENFVQEGLVNRITPFHTNESNNFDTEKVYTNLMKKYKFGGLEKPGLYLDETVTRMCATHRRLFGSLLSHLIRENKLDKAKEVILYAEKVIPTYNVPMTYMNGGADFADAYYRLGMTKKGEETIDAMWKNSVQYVRYYLSLNQSRFMSSQRDCVYHLYIMQRFCEIASPYNKTLADKMTQNLNQLITAYQSRGGNLGGE